MIPRPGSGQAPQRRSGQAVWRRLVRFNAVGALGIVVQLTAIWALTDGAALPYLTATVIAVSAAVVHNFLWHLKWTWGDRPMTPAAAFGAFLRFVSANGLVSLTGNVVIMTALTGGAGLRPVAANVVAIAACGLVNFWLGEQVVFRDYSSRRTSRAVRECLVLTEGRRWTEERRNRRASDGGPNWGQCAPPPLRSPPCLRAN